MDFDANAVGGKSLTLARLIPASLVLPGFPVPSGSVWLKQVERSMDSSGPAQDSA